MLSLTAQLPCLGSRIVHAPIGGLSSWNSNPPGSGTKLPCSELFLRGFKQTDILIGEKFRTSWPLAAMQLDNPHACRRHHSF